MTDIEQKALALLNKVLAERPFGPNDNYIYVTLCRAIEQHEAFRQEVSDAVLSFWPTKPPPEQFSRFIIAKPDPVRVLAEVLEATGDDEAVERAWRIRGLMANRGYEWRKIEGEG